MFERAEHYNPSTGRDDWTGKTVKGMARIPATGKTKLAAPAAGQEVIPRQGDPHKPGFDPKSVPFHQTQLEDFRREAAEPVRVKVKYDYEDVRGIRDRGEAQGRRVFNREAKRSRYLSFSDVGVV
jgi:hypothetical protein